jgi:hypothetical protein
MRPTKCKSRRAKQAATYTVLIAPTIMTRESASPPPKKTQELSASREESFTFIYSPEEHGINGEICSICLEHYQSGNVLNLLKCGHLHHLDCMEEWFVHGSTCPTCRTNLRRCSIAAPLQDPADLSALLPDPADLSALLPDPADLILDFSYWSAPSASTQ